MARRLAKESQPNREFRKSPPFYEQVANILRAKIISDDEGQPVRLPPERDLCGIHKVSRITIRKAMDRLEREGLVKRTPSRGTLTVPSAIAQWKRLRQDRVIHVISVNDPLLNVPTSIYGQVFQGILERSEQAGYRLSVQTFWVHRISAALDLRLPPKDETLGVIFIGCMNEVMIRHCTDANYPVVCTDFWTTNPKADAVVADCYGEGQTAVEFLLRQGHTQFFYIGNLLSQRHDFERESDAELLLAGMQRSLVLAGLPPIPAERIRFSGSKEEDAPETARWFLSLRPRPTAGLIFSAGMCTMLRAHLKDHGLRCPEDLSLITKVCEGEITEMACMRAPVRAMGLAAVDVLLDRAAGRRSSAVRIAIASSLDRGRTIRQIR